MCRTSVGLAILLAAGPIHAVAQTPPPAGGAPVAAGPVDTPKSVAGADHDDNLQHSVSVTLSPLHLVMPMVELTGEYRLADKLGVAGILGAGSIAVTDAVGTPRFTAFEVGGQFRYYPLGSFIHGLQVGAEVLMVYLSGSVGAVSATGAGVSAGPFVGYKIASNIGFTFDVQLGPAFMLVGAQASAGGRTESAKESQVGPLLNINLGWSFGG
jgi:hypothetical protein